MLRTHRVQIIAGVLLLLAALVFALAIPAGAEPARFVDNYAEGSWHAHVTGLPSMNGDAWLKKTPCGLGSFLKLNAPCVAGSPTVETLVLREPSHSDQVLAVVPSDYPDFGIVIAYWPTGTALFPNDPNPLYVQFEPNKSYGDRFQYPYSGPLALTADEFYELLESGNVWVDVSVEGEVVLSGRILR